MKLNFAPGLNFWKVSSRKVFAIDRNSIQDEKKTTTHTDNGDEESVNTSLNKLTYEVHKLRSEVRKPSITRVIAQALKCAF